MTPPDHYRFVAKHLKPAPQTSYPVRAKVWLYSGAGAWHFVTVPAGTSKILKRRHGARAKGWGSLPVTVELGETTWKTSIFPYKGAYILPLKAEVRKRESVRKGDTVRLRLTV